MLQFFLLAVFAAVPAFSQVAGKPAPIRDPRCANITCPIGSRCEIQHLTCRDPPCPAPRVQCVPGDPMNPCAVKLCPRPQVCKAVQVQCFAPPCYPIAECVNPGNGTNGNQCGRNEFFNSCGGCDNTCEQKVVMCPAICRLPGQCRCSPGFYRNQQGQCVTEAQCDKENGSQQCGENEYFDSCGGCDNTCENKNVICALICRMPGKCRCSQGFYRNQAGNCVTEAQCDAAINV